MKKQICSQDIIAKLKKIIALILFLLLLGKVFASITYVFRNSNNNRLHVVGIQEEEPLDMIYVGGSAAFVYWEPLKAWNDCGFSSYNLATDTIQAESIKYYIKWALKHHNPRLFVIGVRAFQYFEKEVEGEAGIRNSSDSLDLGIDRINLVNEYLNNRIIEENIEEISLYIDIMRYHSNYSALENPDNWSLINNKGSSVNKGFEWIKSYQYLREPKNYFSEERAELPEENISILCDLLDFCKEENLDVLFVVCPYQIDKEDYEKYNTIADVITSYGFDFLNANDYYKKMKIDFSTDFYNGDHVNCYGAEKYTDFLENYILDNYEMPDHREEDIYDSWNEDYKRFEEEESETKEEINKLINSVKEGCEIGKVISQTTNFTEWSKLVNDSRFTILAVANEGLSEIGTVVDREAFTQMGLDFAQNGKPYIRVVHEGNTMYTNNGKEDKKYEAIVGTEQGAFNSHCIIENSNGELSIKIDGEEFSRKDNGINIVIYENDYHYVVDSITLKHNEKGKIEIIR